MFVIIFNYIISEIRIIYLTAISYDSDKNTIFSSILVILYIITIINGASKISYLKISYLLITR